MATGKTSNISKTRAIRVIEELIVQFEELEAKLLSSSKYDYENLFNKTVGFIAEIYSREEAEKFMEEVSNIEQEIINYKNINYRNIFRTMGKPSSRRGYMNGVRYISGLLSKDTKDNKLGEILVTYLRIEHCIKCLEAYKQRIQLWQDGGDSYSMHIEQAKEVVMGDYHSNDIMTGDITAQEGSIALGRENIATVSIHAASGQAELAQALKALADAVMASHDLPEDKKEEQVKVINQISKEAAEPKPNKTLLKILTDGLLATLKAVPDVAGAVTAVMPFLSQLHL